MIGSKLKIDEWVQQDTRGPESSNQNECKSIKQHQTRCWDRSVFVPAGMQPVDIIRTYPFAIPLPPFRAGQISVNKYDVECIASAMVDSNLRWRNMFDFVIAPYEAPPRPMETDSLAPEDYVGRPVLISGHHRFLALLLCGLSPPELPPIQVRPAALAVSNYPWSIVEWGA